MHKDDWKQVAKEAILADGVIDDKEIKIIQKAIKGADGDEGLAFLLDLRNSYSKKAKAQGAAVSEAFESFFFKTINGHVVKEGKLGADGVGFLRETVFPGGKVDDRGYKFLGELNKKAKDKAPEFDAFMQDVEKKRSKAAKKP
jgi:hypothetical protein